MLVLSHPGLMLLVLLVLIGYNYYVSAALNPNPFFPKTEALNPKLLKAEP